ncbi:lanthionine synthetase LanC family protein [Haliangium ochraceum]|uniref:lanthionine synthetase LanC family protein n=1 Tax=Haliangium ochraceum TaxID=80816 RepID=UPI00019BAAB3|nr:lanthionine synthetase LanC family protein [Haliangium ochraceum]
MAYLSSSLLVNVTATIAESMRSAHSEGDEPQREAKADASDDLYGGALGDAVFLAAYAQCSGAQWARELALRLAQPTRRAANADTGASPQRIGGFVGVGAQIYGLVTLARLSGESALVSEADALAATIELDAIAADRKLDVVHGSAGLILALLALDAAPHASPENRAARLSRVRAACAHLLAQQQAHEPWRGAWMRSDSPVPQSGLAHGATGISLALTRAAAVLADDALLAAAGAGLAFERAHCAVAGGRWRVAPGDSRVPVGWCRGTPGGALGRHLILVASRGAVPEAAALEREIAHSLSYLSALPPLPLDHLCCGGMSVVDALLEFHHSDASWLSEPTKPLLALAHERATWILRAAKTRGHFSSGSESASDLSLFQGLAGVGYGFLRLAQPESLPCLLSFA